MVTRRSPKRSRDRLPVRPTQTGEGATTTPRPVRSLTVAVRKRTRSRTDSGLPQRAANFSSRGSSPMNALPTRQRRDTISEHAVALSYSGILTIPRSSASQEPLPDGRGSDKNAIYSRFRFTVASRELQFARIIANECVTHTTTTRHHFRKRHRIVVLRRPGEVPLKGADVGQAVARGCGQGISPTTTSALRPVSCPAVMNRRRCALTASSFTIYRQRVRSVLFGVDWVARGAALTSRLRGGA